MEKTNFKNWGWWAIGGLVAVLVVVGVVISISSGPKPSEDSTTAEEQGSEEEKEDKTDEAVDVADAEEAEKPAVDNSVATTESDLPQSGPEDYLWAILLAGGLGYGLSFGAMSLAKKVKQNA